jgi:hypothetical protein
MHYSSSFIIPFYINHTKHNYPHNLILLTPRRKNLTATNISLTKATKLVILNTVSLGPSKGVIVLWDVWVSEYQY